MPNWCSNTMELVGPEEDLNIFKNAVISSNPVSILETFLPLTGKMGERVEWDYDLALETWGTKWPDSETQINNHSSVNLEFNFVTAWSPPIIGIMTISKIFPNILFTLYYEGEGMEFIGQIVTKNGKVLKQNYRDDWYINYEMLEKANLTEEEIESAIFAFDEYYDESTNWRKSPKTITKQIIKEIKAERN